MKFIFGEIPPVNISSLFDQGDNKFRALNVTTPLSIQTTNNAYLTINADCYNKSEVDSRIANLVGSALAMLNPFKEFAAALSHDRNFSTSITNLIGTKANQSTTYTETEVDNKLILKANQSTTYTKHKLI